MANPFKEEQEITPSQEALLTHFEASPEVEDDRHGVFRRRFEKAHEQLYNDVVKAFEDELLRLVRNRPDLTSFSIRWADLHNTGRDLPARLTESLINHMIEHFSKEGFKVTAGIGQFVYDFVVLPFGED